MGETNSSPVSTLPLWKPAVAREGRSPGTGSSPRSDRPEEAPSMPRHPPTTAAVVPLDAVVRLDAPERIVFDYPLGVPFRRFVAYLLDLAILACLVIVALMTSLM